MTSECRKMLCGMTTAPRTPMITGIAPIGKAGVTQPAKVWVQETSAIQISKTKARPIRETKPMIHFSSRW